MTDEVFELEATGTPFGFHYYSDFQDCPRYFFFKHVLKLEPEFEKPNIWLGKIFHALKKRFYETLSEDGSVEQLKALVAYVGEKRFGLKYTLKDAEALLSTAWSNWLVQFGRSDLTQLEVLAVEQDFDFTVDNLRLTGQLDLVARRIEDGQLLLIDTKTSGSMGAEYLGKAAEAGDQMSVYSMAVQELYGGPEHETPLVVIDGACLKGRDPKCGRYEFIRTDDEIADCLIGLQRTKANIADARTLFDARSELWRSAWPRQTLKCSAWGCAYETFCRSGLQNFSDIPTGFIRRVER